MRLSIDDPLIKVCKSLEFSKIITNILKQIATFMNWLAHIFLSEPTVENRLGNLLGDLVKGKDLDRLDPLLRSGVNRHYAIDRFTDSHPTIKISKQRIDREYSRFAGILIDVFYDHFLATNWATYSSVKLADFTHEIHTSFQAYPGDLPQFARETIDRMICGDWLTSYQQFSGIEATLARIDYRIQARMGDSQSTRLRQLAIELVTAMPILEREYSNLDRDFNLFFPELQQHIHDWSDRQF
jgi:acyl carrier protein phosphodiesterase